MEERLNKTLQMEYKKHLFCKETLSQNLKRKHLMSGNISSDHIKVVSKKLHLSRVKDNTTKKIKYNSLKNFEC